MAIFYVRALASILYIGHEVPFWKTMYNIYIYIYIYIV
jgi:hypothetical protein